MSLYARMIVVLTCVGVISGSLLSVVGVMTTERIARNRQREIEAAITRVIPGTSASEKLYEEEDLVVYTGLNAQGERLGYAVYASGTGFQDIISLMYGTDIDMTVIHSLTVIEQKETPGLGAKITDREAFLRFWQNRDISQPLTLHKPAVKTPDELSRAEVNTITGATISSEKVLSIVNLSLDAVKKIRTEGKLESKTTHGS